MNAKSVLATAALAGLLMGVGCGSSETSDTKTPPMGECHGMNSCKGTGACGGDGHSCAGQNNCKGKGWLKMSKVDCEAKGGVFKS